MSLIDDIEKLEQEISDLDWEIHDLEEERYEKQSKLDKLEKALQSEPELMAQLAAEQREKFEERKQVNLIKAKYGTVTKQIADYWTR